MADESPMKRKRISPQELAKLLIKERVPLDGLEIKMINDEIAPSTGLTPVKSDVQKDIKVINKAKDSLSGTCSDSTSNDKNWALVAAKDTPSSTCNTSASKDREQDPTADEKKPRKKWTKEEKDALLAAFETCFLAGRVPRKKECQDAMRKFSLLAGRSWRNLVFQVKNVLVTRKLRKTAFVTK